MPEKFTFLAVLFLAASAPSGGASVASSSGTTVSGADAEKLADTFEGLRRGTFVTLELTNGQVMPGLFQSYDDYYGKVWIIPKGDAGTFRAKSVRLSSVLVLHIAAQMPGVKKAKPESEAESE